VKTAIVIAISRFLRIRSPVELKKIERRGRKREGETGIKKYRQNIL